MYEPIKRHTHTPPLIQHLGAENVILHTENVYFKRYHRWRFTGHCMQGQPGVGRQNTLCQCHICDITSCQYSLQPRNADAEALHTAVALVFMLRLSRMLLHLNATPLLVLRRCFSIFANHKSLPHLPQAPSLLFSADAAGSKTRLRLWLMCSYNMADSDH